MTESAEFPRAEGWRPTLITAVWTEEGANGTELVVASRQPGEPFHVLVRTAGPLTAFMREGPHGTYEYAIEQRTELLHDPNTHSNTVSRMSIVHGDKLSTMLLNIDKEYTDEE